MQIPLGFRTGPADATPVTCLYDHSSARIVAVDEQTLFLNAGGDVREEDIAPFFEALERALDELQPRSVLVDATYFGEASLRLRWRILRRLGCLRGRVERTAVYGLSPKLEAALWLLFTLARRRDVRTFLWRHEAESWVLGAPGAELYA